MLRQCMATIGLLAAVVTGSFVAPAPASATGAPAAPAATIAPSSATADAGIAATRLVGKFVQQNRSSGTSAWASVGYLYESSVPDRQWWSDRGDAISAAASYDFPAQGTSGPIRGTGAASGICLEVTGRSQDDPVRGQVCNGSAAQEFSYQTVSNNFVSGTGVYSAYAGYFIGQYDRGQNPSVYPLVNTQRGAEDALDFSSLRTVVGVSVSTPGYDSTVRTSRPEIGGNGQAGARIELKSANGFVLDETTVSSAGSWRITPKSDFPLGRNAGTAVQTFDGAQSTADWAFTVAQAVEVSITSPAEGENVTTAQPTISGGGEPGASIVVTDQNGAVLAQTTVSTRGTWSQTSLVELTKNTAYRATATQTFEGRTSTASVSFTYNVIDEQPRPLVVESPTVGGVFLTGADGRATPVFSGTATPGATVEVITGNRDEVGSTEVDANGAWSITWNKSLLPNTYANGGKTIQSIGGEIIDSVLYNFEVKAPFTAPLVVESPTVGGSFDVDVLTGVATPVFSGTASPGAEVKIITAWTELVGTTTADADGVWSITWNKALKPSSKPYEGGYTVQTLNGAQEKVAYSFFVTSAAVAVAVTSPEHGGTIQAGADGSAMPVFEGTGTEGARIKIVTSYGTNMGEATVVDGTWSITWNTSIVPTDYRNVRTLQYVYGRFHSDVYTDFTVTK